MLVLSHLSSRIFMLHALNSKSSHEPCTSKRHVKNLAGTNHRDDVHDLQIQMILKWNRLGKQSSCRWKTILV